MNCNTCIYMKHMINRGPAVVGRWVTQCLANGFQTETSLLWIQWDRKMTMECSWGERIYTQLYSHGGESITGIPSIQSKSACSKPVPASGPLRLRSHPSLCPQCCHHSSFCPPAALQPCSNGATVSPRALGKALYVESIITTYFSHLCSEQANQGQVRILVIGSFTFSTCICYYNSVVKSCTFK